MNYLQADLWYNAKQLPSCRRRIWLTGESVCENRSAAFHGQEEKINVFPSMVMVELSGCAEDRHFLLQENLKKIP